MSVGCGVSVVTRHLNCVCLVSEEYSFAVFEGYLPDNGTRFD